MHAIGWVDIALLGVLAVSVIVGLVRGLVLEVLSLVGWVVAYFAAQWLAPQVAPHLPIGTPRSALNLGAAFALAFIAVLIAWSVAARLVSLLVKATPLGFVDRVLGAVFGLLRGGVLLLVLATVIALTPWAKSTAWKTSQGALWLNGVLDGLKPVLPPSVAQRLPTA